MDENALRRLTDRLTPGRWFGGLPAALQRAILLRSRMRSFDKGQVIGLEGQAPVGLSAVLEGQVQIVRHAGMADEALIYVGGPGFWFGEYALLADEAPRALVSVIARTRASVLVLPKQEFERIVEEEPRYLRDFTRLAVARLAVFLRAYVQVSSLATEIRLRGQLALLTQMKAEEASSRGPVDLHLSQADLAAIAGMSRQRINPMLRDLARQGLIELGFRRIRILQPDRLFDDNLADSAHRGRRIEPESKRRRTAGSPAEDRTS